MHIYNMTIILTLACNDFHDKKYKIEFWLFNLNNNFFLILITINANFLNKWFIILFVFFTHSYVVT